MSGYVPPGTRMGHHVGEYIYMLKRTEEMAKKRRKARYIGYLMTALSIIALSFLLYFGHPYAGYMFGVLLSFIGLLAGFMNISENQEI